MAQDRSQDLLLAHHLNRFTSSLRTGRRATRHSLVGSSGLLQAAARTMIGQVLRVEMGSRNFGVVTRGADEAAVNNV